MRQSNNAIHRATQRRIQPQLPAGFSQRTMLRIHRRERMRELIQYIIGGIAIIALFIQCMRWAFTQFPIHFDFDFTFPEFDFSMEDFALVKRLAIIAVPLILMLLLDSYLRLKMQTRFLFKDDKK